MTFPAGWSEGVGLAIVGLVMALLAAEGGVRLLARLSPNFGDRLKQYDLLAVQIQPMGHDGYRQRPNGVFHYPSGAVIRSNALGYRGPVVAVPKPPGTLRVVLVGGSATYGWGVNDEETIDAYLRQRLATRYPNLHVEVLNLAFDGYDSYQIHERVRIDAFRFEPDFVVVNAGVNDVRNAKFPELQDDPDPRTLLYLTMIRKVQEQQARGRPSLTTRVKHFSAAARLASLVRDGFRRSQESEGQAAEGPVPNMGAVDYFERNLRRTAALLADHRAALLLSPEPSGIPGNFAADAVSPRSYWITNAAVTQQVRDSLAARMRAVVADLRGQGQRVVLVPHHLSPDVFLDDAHLKPAGNEAMAADFEAAVAALLDAGQPRGRPVSPSTSR